MQQIEIEKTYLAKSLPKEIHNCSPITIVDTYFPDDEATPTLRLRKKQDRYMLTKKIQQKEGDASSHIEQTIALTEKEYRQFAKLRGKTVEKKRYTFTWNGREVEVDVFAKNLKGLVLVEFEFCSQRELQKFEKPLFCLADVTQENFIAGKFLAGKTYADIEEDLQKFDYQKLSL